MIEQLKTIRAALDILRGAVGHEENVHTADIALAALTQLEAMVGEPVQLDHIACIDGGELRYMTGRKAPAYDCELYAMPDGKRAPNLYAAPVAQHPQYEAGDMASAHNDGFRAGVASVAQQPQEIEVQCPVCSHKFYEWPNDQQPQAEAVPSDVARDAEGR